MQSPGIRPLWNAAFLTLLLLCLWSRDARSQKLGPDSTIQLSIRFHLLNSEEGKAVSTNWNEQDVHALLRIANEVWSQAGIVWVIESIVEEEPPHAARFDSLVAGQLLPTGERQRSIIPRESLLAVGWDVFLIRDYGQIAGGVFWPEIPALVLAAYGMGVELEPEGRGGRTLAHELGHSLGLTHEECDRSAPNIMALGCWRPGALSTLAEDQIQGARNQARFGPVRGLSAVSFP